MTRDEAIKKFSGAWPNGSGGDEKWGGVWVDSFAALGILKLDEPKSAISKKIEKACSLSATKADHWQRLARGLELAGLKVVEK
jgi:hypothetical protein